MSGRRIARGNRQLPIALKERDRQMQMHSNRPKNRNVRWISGLFGLVALLSAVLATPALATGPVLDVTLERDATSVSRSDERVDYTAEVSNAASVTPSAGDELSCEPGTWTNTATFAYRWLRNGQPITGQTENSYVVQPIDAGKVLQCVVLGTSAGGSSMSVASMPPTVVNPSPVPSPPAPLHPTSQNSQPTISPSTAAHEGDLLTCSAPVAEWTGSGITWELVWLREGQEELSSATGTTSSYTVTAADVGHLLQCEAIPVDEAGSAAAVFSSRKPIEVSGAPSQNPNAPPVASSGSVAGVVTLEVELPGGDETYAYAVESIGWSCVEVPAHEEEHAKVVCERADGLAPGTSYPPVTVITALGADAPDHAVAKATVFGGGAASSASDEDAFDFDPFKEFGLTAGGFESRLIDSEGNDYQQAGGHPYAGKARYEFVTRRVLVPENEADESTLRPPIGHVRQVFADIPTGITGNALALPELCSGVDEVLALTCPAGSAVGGVSLLLSGLGGAEIEFPIFAIEPEFGTPAEFAFRDPLKNVYTLSARLRPGDGYGVSLELAPAAEVPLLKSSVQICDFGAELITTNDIVCKQQNDPTANPKPLFTNMTRCADGPPVTRTRLDSWENPGVFKEYSYPNAPVTGCDIVPFEPTVEELKPSTVDADSASGLDQKMTMPVEGLNDPGGIAQANLKRAKITFPKGMSVNASAAGGLGACSGEQVGIASRGGRLVPDGEPAHCPDASKVGTVTIKTPILEETLTGDVYAARQGEVEGALIGLYLVFESAKDGIIVKVPGRVDPDPATGQLVATVDNIPQAPFSSVEVHVAGGPQATLVTPPKCGTYQIKTELSPWSAVDPNNPTAAETVTQTSSFTVDHGPGGGGCPSGELKAMLNAGSSNPVAGETSPFVMRLSRDDGTERFSGLNIHTPPGLTGYLKGIPYCPDSTIASISTDLGTGQAQIDSPSCPAASQIGTIEAGAGVGANPFYVNTGRAYLAGPYKGAPVSILAVVPAVAGPFDLGSVVIRNAVYVDPESAQLSVVSDPIPTIIHGVLPDVRDIRVKVDRSHFTLNPTNCEPMSVKVDVKGENGGRESLSNHFQVRGCNKLRFEPKTFFRLFGGTRRGVNPKLRGVFVPGKKGRQANLNRLAVTIPRSEFLDQSHIRTVCTRVQFAADACPKGSIYGHVKAFSPIVDYAVRGPVYLRSSSHKLPDLVVDLHGPAYQPVEVIASARIDSVKGQIRATFEHVPDVPVSKILFFQQGGKKGLLVNSRNICAHRYRATVNGIGQNAKRSHFRPAMSNSRCRKQRRAKRKHRGHHRKAAHHSAAADRRANP